MVKTIIKYLYWSLFVSLLLLVGIKYFTPKPQPIKSTDLPALVTYNTRSKTYSNSNFGTYHYLGYTIANGIFYSKQATNRKLIIIKFKFTNTSNQAVKPYTDLRSILILKQNGHTLKTGNLELDNKNTALINQVNNAVKIYQPKQQAKIALPYIYQNNSHSVTIYLAKHQLGKLN